MKENDQRGGVARIFAFPVESVLRIRQNYRMRTVTPELSKRDSLIKFPVLPESGYLFNEDSSLSEHGQVYNVRISGRLPEGSLSDEQLDLLQHGQWMVVHVDRLGNAKLSGTTEVPLQFSCSSTTGDVGSAYRGIDFQFDGVEGMPSAPCFLADIDTI